MNADETLHTSNEFILKVEEKSVLHGFLAFSIESISVGVTQYPIQAMKIVWQEKTIQINRTIRLIKNKPKI